MDENGIRRTGKKGYLKIHVDINTKTKEILALDGGNRRESTLRENTKETGQQYCGYLHKKKIKSVLADGAYDSNTNFRYLEEKKITPAIKVRRNSIVSSKNNRLRNMEVKVTNQ